MPGIHKADQEAVRENIREGRIGGWGRWLGNVNEHNLELSREMIWGSGGHTDQRPGIFAGGTGEPAETEVGGRQP
jgi:hypothetical protein